MTVMTLKQQTPVKKEIVVITISIHPFYFSLFNYSERKRKKREKPENKEESVLATPTAFMLNLRKGAKVEIGTGENRPERDKPCSHRMVQLKVPGCVNCDTN